jgi:hypothetical protein
MMNIRKAFKSLAAITLLLGSTWALADPPAQVGRLNYLWGTVSFAPADAPNEWGAAPINRPLTSGDRLWADNDGRVEMRIGSTAIRMAALTSMDVLRLDEFGAQLRLAQGTLNVHLRRLDVGDSFEISTPGGAVLLTQPGSYRVNVDPAGATTAVLVRRGQADVLTGNAPYVVRDNQLSFISAQGQEVYAAPAPDEFDNWAMTRDRQEARVVATRYVPQEMTGYEDLDQHGAWRTVPEYGAVWVPTTVAADWAPYRQGHWVWISPWGWTWVDNAPWGFAPYHYGRWVWLGNHWGWAPGARVARPVYAPALVAFVGGANWSVTVGGGPAVGWVPLGWREPYIPWYRHSPTYVRNVNITHVTNITVINHYTNVNNVNHIRYVNRDVPSGTTVVTRDTFVSARHVHESRLNVPGHALSAARVTHEAPVALPERGSLVLARPGPRVPAAIAAREVIAVTAPPAAVAPVTRGPRDSNPGNTSSPSNTTGDPGRAVEHDRRIRVIGAQPRSTAIAQPKAADTPPPAPVDRVPSVVPPAVTVAPAAPAPVAPATPAASPPTAAPVTPTAVERRGPPREPRANTTPTQVTSPVPAQAAVPAPVPAPAPPQVDAPTQPQRPVAPAPAPAPATAATSPPTAAPVTPAAVERRGPPREPRVNTAPAQAAAPVPTPVAPQVDVQAQQRQAQQEQQRQARLQADAQAQQQRQAQQEQQRQAQQQQQARLQAQKEQQHQAVQQRAQQVQQQRDQQYQQAQQVEQQRQVKQQQLHAQQQAQRQAERAEKQRRADAQPPQAPPAQPQQQR